MPSSYDGSAPLPVILALHGGGGGRDDAKHITCPDGDFSSSECLTPLADARGFAVVAPDGTGPSALVKRLRTWNAGGGSGGRQCVSGSACTDGVDEAAYWAKAVRSAFSPRLPERRRRRGGAAASARGPCEGRPVRDTRTQSAGSPPRRASAAGGGLAGR